MWGGIVLRQGLFQRGNQFLDVKIDVLDVLNDLVSPDKITSNMASPSICVPADDSSPMALSLSLSGRTLCGPFRYFLDDQGKARSGIGNRRYEHLANVRRNTLDITQTTRKE